MTVSWLAHRAKSDGAAGVMKASFGVRRPKSTMPQQRTQIEKTEKTNHSQRNPSLSRQTGGR